MRSREHLEEVADKMSRADLSTETVAFGQRKLILEVLLDIRDLLSAPKQNHEY